MTADKKNSNKLLALALAVVIIIAVVVLIYVNLPQQEKVPSSPLTSEVLFNFIYGEQQTNYTLEDLQTMDTYTGFGGYKTRYPSIKGPYEYTGVNVTTLSGEFNNLPTNYTLRVTASDGWVTNYTIDEIQGDVTIYNASGNKTGVGGVTMLLAFAEAGDYNFSDGPLRIAYVNDDEPYTDSFLWSKYVVTIEIMAER